MLDFEDFFLIENGLGLLQITFIGPIHGVGAVFQKEFDTGVSFHAEVLEQAVFDDFIQSCLLAHVDEVDLGAALEEEGCAL